MIFPNNPKSFVEKEHKIIATGLSADMQSVKRKNYMKRA
jgi:hypothetical protein